MIQVTLNFPDQAAMLAYFAAPATPAAPAKVEAPKSVKAEKPAATQPVIEKPAPTTTATESPSDPKPEASTSSAKPSDSVDYPTLQKAVFALAGKSRESAAAVAASMGVKTFKELPESKWAEALAAVNVALAA